MQGQEETAVAVVKSVPLQCHRAEVPNLGYMYPYGCICLSQGVHLRLAIEEKYIFTYLFFPKIYTYISKHYFEKLLCNYF